MFMNSLYSSESIFKKKEKSLGIIECPLAEVSVDDRAKAMFMTSFNRISTLTQSVLSMRFSDALEQYKKGP